jgi:hypothetical protein
MCSDVWADFSDISFADAYIPSIMQSDSRGTSVLMVRTKKGQNLVEEIQQEKKIKLVHISSNTALRTQLFMTVFKKRNILARIRLLKMFRKKVQPSLDTKKVFFRPTIWDYIFVPVPFINIKISRNHFLCKAMQLIPLKILALYRKGYKWFLVRQTKEYFEE